MILTTQMTQLFAVVLRRDKERVTETLLREGVMQFIHTSEIDLERPDQPVQSDPETALAALSDLRKRIQGILRTVDAVPAALMVRAVVGLTTPHRRVVPSSATVLG